MQFCQSTKNDMQDSAILNRADSQAACRMRALGFLLDFSFEMIEQLNYVWVLCRGFSGLMFDFSLQGCILLLKNHVYN